jgi:hypothetical protein
MEDEADHHGAANPAQAFEDLRAEVSVLGRAVARSSCDVPRPRLARFAVPLLPGPPHKEA